MVVKVVFLVALMVAVLVLLEVPLQPDRYLAIDLGLDVAVLVLLEVPLQPITSQMDAIQAFLLQSLFCWKSLCNSRKFAPIA